MYTMDNVEVLAGLRAGAALAKALRDPRLQGTFRAAAEKMQSSIGALEWNETAHCYRIGIQTDGGKMEGLKVWYPDVMANLMAVAWLPASRRNRELYLRLRRQFSRDIPKEVKSQDDLEHFIWWGYAAANNGDPELLKLIRTRLRDFDRAFPNGVDSGDLGHVARIAEF